MDAELREEPELLVTGSRVLRRGSGEGLKKKSVTIYVFHEILLG